MNKITLGKISQNIQLDWGMRWQQDIFPWKYKFTDEDYRQNNTLSGKTGKKADERENNKKDFLEKTNWLKKIVGKTRHCWERLINRLMNKITIRQISSKIQID